MTLFTSFLKEKLKGGAAIIVTCDRKEQRDGIIDYFDKTNKSLGLELRNLANIRIIGHGTLGRTVTKSNFNTLLRNVPLNEMENHILRAVSLKKLLDKNKDSEYIIRAIAKGVRVIKIDLGRHRSGHLAMSQQAGMLLEKNTMLLNELHAALSKGRLGEHFNAIRKVAKISSEVDQYDKVEESVAFFVGKIIESMDGDANIAINELKKIYVVPAYLLIDQPLNALYFLERRFYNGETAMIVAENENLLQSAEMACKFSARRAGISDLEPEDLAFFELINRDELSNSPSDEIKRLNYRFAVKDYPLLNTNTPDKRLEIITKILKSLPYKDSAYYEELEFIAGKQRLPVMHGAINLGVVCEKYNERNIDILQKIAKLALIKRLTAPLKGKITQEQRIKRAEAIDILGYLDVIRKAL